MYLGVSNEICYDIFSLKVATLKKYTCVQKKTELFK